MQSCTPYDRAPDRLEVSRPVDDEYSRTPSYYPLSDVRTSTTLGKQKGSSRLDSVEVIDKKWIGDSAYLIPPGEQVISSLFGRRTEDAFRNAFGRQERGPKRPYSWSPYDDHPPPPLAPLYLSHDDERVPLSSKSHPRRRNIQDLIDDELNQGDATPDFSLPDRDNTMAPEPDACDDSFAMDVDIEPPSLPETRLAASCPGPLPAHLDEDPQIDVVVAAVEILPRIEADVLLSPPPPSPRSDVLRSKIPPPEVQRQELPRISPPHMSRPRVLPMEADTKQTRTKKSKSISHRQSLPSILRAQESEHEGGLGSGLASDLDAPASISSHGSSKAKSSSSNTKRQSQTVKAGLPTCLKCSQSFTRNFDLQRHIKQKHKQGKEEDPAKTCTHCEVVLSRPDAAMRHVKAIPESCNHVRRKEGRPELPAQPAAFYEECKVRFEKLAEQYKKPKGRKKANPEQQVLAN